MAKLRRPGGVIVGRSVEVRAVRDALVRGRLVNLVGPGGVGKTALAAEVINEVEPEFDRVVMLELAEAAGDELVRLLGSAAVGEATADIDHTIEVLAAVPTLLVIDNCEHVVEDVAGLVATVLDATSDLTVLATSRRPLDLAGEITWTVQPLDVPQPLAPGSTELAGSTARDHERMLATGSVQLFLERVRQAVPNFEVTDANRGLVAEVCVAADGLPLAIELAAALVRNRPLDEIVRVMTDHLDGLASARRDRPEHQRSITGSLDWSRQFLDQADEQLLNRLAVFVGGFTSAAAQAVAPENSTLANLVDHSLVGFDPATGRYSLLEVVRVDADARLDGAERASAEQGHHAACLKLVAELEAERYEADPENRFPRFEAELPNLCAALRRSLERGDINDFRALLGPIAVWLVHYVAPDDPEVWVTAFKGDEVPPLWRGNVTAALGYYWSHRGHHDRALEQATAARALHRLVGATAEIGLDEVAIGNAKLALGDDVGARQAYEAGLRTAAANGHRYAELTLRVALARLNPKDDETRGHLVAARSLASGFGAVEAVLTTELGLQSLADGQLAEARTLCDEALTAARAVAYSEALASALCGRAEVAIAEGDLAAASEWFEEAFDIARRTVHEGLIERVTRGLATISETGERQDSSPSPDLVELSDRELAVARLLRGDLTQREIADELYIAPSTVKTHIKSIYRKLQVTKRSYAVTRATELGLFD